VKKAKYGFELYPDTSQNGKIWISLCPFVDPAKNKIYIYYVRTQVKIAKDGFDLYPDTSQNRKIWQLNLMEKCVLYDRGSIQIKKN